MYVRKEAVLSSQIEGTQSSLQDLLAAQSELFEPSELPRDVDEIINYVAALNHGLERLSELRCAGKWTGAYPSIGGCVLLSMSTRPRSAASRSPSRAIHAPTRQTPAPTQNGARSP